jgi:hypothetical protein
MAIGVAGRRAYVGRICDCPDRQCRAVCPNMAPYLQLPLNGRSDTAAPEDCNKMPAVAVP